MSVSTRPSSTRSSHSEFGHVSLNAPLVNSIKSLRVWPRQSQRAPRQLDQVTQSLATSVSTRPSSTRSSLSEFRPCQSQRAPSQLDQVCHSLTMSVSTRPLSTRSSLSEFRPCQSQRAPSQLDQVSQSLDHDSLNAPLVNSIKFLTV